MRGSERTAVTVSRVSMLSICTTPECTTIVFGRGTCVDHDERGQTGADSPLTETAPRSEPAERTVETLAPVV